MQTTSPGKTIFMFITLVAAVVILSLISARIWGGKPETLPKIKELTVTSEMSVMDFGQANGLPNPVLKEIFGLQVKADLQRNISEFGTDDQIKSLVIKNIALGAEHESKNWQKIAIKFAAWFAFLGCIFFYFRKRKAVSSHRNTALLLSSLIFGVILGADPSPMGTVKDAIHLYGTAGAIFPPRMIALTAFLLLVFLANKYICAWGCQVGVLQDLIFRLNQDRNNKAVLGKQIKLPFVFTNTFRIAFFCLFTIVVFTWGTDIFEPIDPFKIYKPIHLGISGIVFVGALLAISLFVYRPWCHLFCPFGLAGWVVEKFSLVKVSVDYETCIACGKCEKACPSTVMGAILRRDRKTIPDCFSCYVCREVCPTESIRFSTRKRTLPPPDHFTAKQ
jgi:NAD-dependent dihydropyrimidine dehydrogenase PreA subunit